MAIQLQECFRDWKKVTRPRLTPFCQRNKSIPCVYKGFFFFFKEARGNFTRLIVKNIHFQPHISTVLYVPSTVVHMSVLQATCACVLTCLLLSLRKLNVFASVQTCLRLPGGISCHVGARYTLTNHTDTKKLFVHLEN